MLISGVHHACVIVSDIERSLSFYRDILGMKEIMNLRFDADPVMMDLPGTKPKQHLVMLSGANAVIELIQYTEPKTKRAEVRPCDYPNMHICFEVKDIKNAYDELVRKGVNTFHRTPDLIDGSGTPLDGHRYVYFRGPDNEILEFIQPPA